MELCQAYIEKQAGELSSNVFNGYVLSRHQIEMAKHARDVINSMQDGGQNVVYHHSPRRSGKTMALLVAARECNAAFACGTKAQEVIARDLAGSEPVEIVSARQIGRVKKDVLSESRIDHNTRRGLKARTLSILS